MAIISNKQKIFVREYLVDLNATAAAGRAGYKDPNHGRHLLAKTHVAAEIQKAMDIRAEKIGLTAEKVLEDIKLIKQDAMSKDDELRMVDRSAALRACELEGKHLKMFTDKVEVAGKDGEPIVIVVEEFKG